MAIPIQLEVERLDLLYQQSLTGLGGFTVHFFCYLFIAHHLLPLTFLIVWPLAMVGIFATRVAGSMLWRRRRGSVRTPAEARKWSRFMQIMMAMTGCGWGVVGYYTGLSPDPVVQTFTAIALMLMATGAMAVYSTSISALYCALIPLVVPWGFRLISSGEVAWVLMGGLGCVYVLMAAWVTRNLNAYVERIARLRVENEELAGVLRDSEARLRLALESSDATAWTWDLRTDTFVFEGHLPATLGIELDRFEGRADHYMEFVHADDRPALRAQMDAAAAGRGELDSEHRVIWPGGSVHDLILRGRAQTGPDGKPLRLIGVCWNVTARRAEAALRHDRDVSDAANKAKSVFLANASHEIRTPLAAINGFAEILTHDPQIPESARADVEVILRNGRYLVSLVNGLLDLSKIETGRLYIQKNRFSPFSEIEDSLRVVEGEAESKKLFLELVYDGAIPEKIESDGNRFRQILTNLLENAVKFTDRGGVTVQVAFEAAGKEGWLVVRVADTGIGLGEEARRQLFQPFARGLSADVQRVQGSGLGLALSRDLSRLLGGDLRLVHSERGAGSEFEVRIATGEILSPLVEKENPRRRSPRPEGEAANEPKRLADRRLLVVDDVPDLRALLKRAFEEQGAAVDTAANGIEALNLALTREYDAILMDVKMPVMSGDEAARILRDRHYGKPVIALTAHASNEDRQRCLAAGFDDYVSKPVDLDHVVGLVGGYVDQASSVTGSTASASSFMPSRA